MHSSRDVPYGRRLVPVMVDRIANEDPDRVCFSYPKSSNIQDGFHDLTFRTFANAVNKTAHFIQREIGRSSMFETVMYMGFPDVRHFIALIALMKTGHKALFSSHRNSVAGHADLIRRTDCTILLHTAGFPVADIVDKCRMETLCMPELDYLLDDGNLCDPYPYTWTFDEAKNHPCLVVHTSGSTGLPKPVIWTQWSLAHTDGHHLVPPLNGRPPIYGEVSDKASRAYNALPVFHGAGLASGIQTSIFNNNVVVLGPPGLPTADTFSEILDYGNVDCVKCVPVTLEEIAERPDILTKLKKLKHIIYTGGQLSPEAGNKICKYVLLYCAMASTETNTLILHATDPEDWQYIWINPQYSGIEMRPAGDLYELFFVKNPDLETFQGVFKVFPRLNEYSMSDLYSKHPTKEDLWKHEGRKDDIIVFKSGWNFNPMIHEHMINVHHAVDHCVVVGTGRRKPAVIIELKPSYYTEDSQEQKELVDEIWEHVEQANDLADTTGQLGKEYVIFAKNTKPFLVAPKGTVQKKGTINLYAKEIEKLYNRLE